jgi:predicted DsbA family dithiol-disulfide isomerase
VPTFMIDHQSVVGAQPYEVLEQFLENNGAKRRPLRSRSVARKA